MATTQRRALPRPLPCLLGLLLGACPGPGPGDEPPPPPAEGPAGDLAAPPSDLPPAPDLAGEPLFDLPALRDPAGARCVFGNQRSALRDGVRLTVWDVSYSSFESRGGRLQPILIRGFAARPAGTERLPGVVQAHGLGGFAEESHATGPAALLGMFVLAYSGPGGGSTPANTSEGLPAGDRDGYRLFDTLPDARGSWFWGHTAAALRGLTCLAGRADVDDGRLGVTGYSAGGVASLMAAGVDDRVKAAVPLSGTGAFSVAMRAGNAWQHPLLSRAGLSATSPEFLRHQQLLDPVALLPGARGRVLLIDGTTDEFFPLTALRATHDALPSGEHRVALSANFDHGCYQLSGGEPARTIEERAALHAEGGQRLWFRHVFATDPRYRYLPRAPQVAAQAVGAATLLSATVDPGGPALRVDEVRVFLSGDDSLVYAGVALDPGPGDSFSKLVPGALPGNAVYYADVVYRTQGLLPERFALSSLPVLPPGFVPRVRAMGTCLP